MRLAPKNDWWTRMAHYPHVVTPPWYKRRFYQLRWVTHVVRERIALLIAPWL